MVDIGHNSRLRARAQFKLLKDSADGLGGQINDSRSKESVIK